MNLSWELVLGPFGVVVLLVYIAKRLADLVTKEWEVKDTRIATLEALNDKLGDALKENNATWLKHVEQDRADAQERADMRAEDRMGYVGDDRRHQAPRK